MTCAITTTFCKADTEDLDYKVDWNDWLDSETISTSAWTVQSGLTKGSDSNTTTTATVWLSGGTKNKTYLVSNTIVTTSARTATRSFYIKLTDR
jgi:hypothetical protein